MPHPWHNLHWMEDIIISFALWCISLASITVLYLIKTVLILIKARKTMYIINYCCLYCTKKVLLSFLRVTTFITKIIFTETIIFFCGETKLIQLSILSTLSVRERNCIHVSLGVRILLFLLSCYKAYSLYTAFAFYFLSARSG